jgi:hypothetical protein
MSGRKHSAGRSSKSERMHHNLESAGRPTEHVPNRTEQDLARERKKEIKVEK